MWWSRISAVGFGQSRPLKTSGSDEDLAMNRRVDIVVLSGQPEAIRNLMPDVIKDPAGAKEAAAERAEAVQKAAEADAAAKAAAEAPEVKAPKVNRLSGWPASRAQEAPRGRSRHRRQWQGRRARAPLTHRRRAESPTTTEGRAGDR